ncbi:MAG: hypothetical protein ACM3QU_08445 [Verrucomicrobiota bacterium]
MIALLAIVLGVPPLLPNVHPWPIGVGPGFRLPPAPAHVLAGKPVGRFRCEVGGRRFGAHIELFAHRRVLIVPAGIGVARPSREHLARLTPGGCSYPARTLEPTGVIEIRRGSRLTVGDLFRIWGQRLGPRRIAGFRGAVLAFVDGKRRRGDPASIPLTRHAQIVLELGGRVAPHPTYRFARGL